MDIQITQEQVPALSPQMILSMNILQMGARELLEHIETVIQENPVLVAIENCGSDNNFRQSGPSLRPEWLETADPQNCTYHRQDQETGSSAWYPCPWQMRPARLGTRIHSQPRYAKQVFAVLYGYVSDKTFFNRKLGEGEAAQIYGREHYDPSA